MEKKEVSFIDTLYVFVKWRKLVILIFIVVCLITAAVSLVLPRWYKAWTIILPPGEEVTASGLSSLINDLPFSGFGIGTGAVSGEASLLIAIVQSRTLMETVAVNFDLMKRYKAKNMEETVRALREHIKITNTDEGTLALSAEAGTAFFAGRSADDESRLLAKNMADFSVQELDRINKRLKTERAGYFRQFIEARYLLNVDELTKAEDAFRAFQMKHGTIAMPEQTLATINAASELKAQIVAKEVELGVLERYLGKGHSEIIRVQNELSEYRSKYNDFIYSKRSGGQDDRDKAIFYDLFVPLDKVPDLGLQYARLYREVMLQEKIMEFLLPQYEQAKINEARDTPTVQVLDEAAVPIKRVRPKRMIMVLIAGFLSLILSGCLIFMLEYWQRISEQGGKEYEKIMTAAHLLKKDFRPGRRRKP